MSMHTYLYPPCPREWKGKPFLSQENRQEAMTAREKALAINDMMNDLATDVATEARGLDDNDTLTFTIKIRANDSAGTIEAYWLTESKYEKTCEKID